MKKERILIIVESPNKVKTISQLLKGTKYEGAIVQASVGHISQIKDGGSYFNTGIEPKDDFKTNYVISSDKKDVVQKLKEQVELATTVYICSDPDREGEAIAWSLRKFLKIPKDKYKRATFHEITKNAVLNALDSPRDIDEDLVDAAQSRQKLDKMLGYRLSPIARRSVGAKSVGRCQSAGLKILVDREKEIRNFKSLEYGELLLNFEKNETVFKARLTSQLKGKIADLEEDKVSYKKCSAIRDELEELNNKGIYYKVIDITTKDKIANPKPPFTTSTFQQEVSNKLNISVKDAMSAAQRLFEGINLKGEHKALITYIRTDSAEFAPEFIPELEKFVKTKYGIKYYAPIRKTKKKDNEQDGHEAIRPVDLTMTPEKLKDYINDSFLIKVYEIIYRRTIATMMASSITAETTYSISCGNYIFNLVSRELKFDGYLKVYNYKEKDDEEVVKETFKVGEEINKKNHINLICNKKQTLPPSRYKEATFIKELESTGIGRPSTFATIVSTILDKNRGYCEVKDNYLTPTEKGIQLSEYLDKAFPKLINVNYTSELEKDLDLIATHKLTELDFLNSFYNNMESYVKDSKQAIKDTATKKEKIYSEDIVCPECGSKMILRKSAYGEFWGCSKYPKCKGIVQINKK